MTFEILQERFEEWGHKLATTMSAVMSASIDRLCPKDSKKEMTDMKENTLKDLQDKDLK